MPACVAVLLPAAACLVHIYYSFPQVGQHWVPACWALTAAVGLLIYALDCCLQIIDYIDCRQIAAS